jgi:chitin disaccharide deacetylase
MPARGVRSSELLGFAPCPWALHAMRLLRQRPEIPFGIHLTLVRDTGYGLVVRVWLEPGRRRMRRRGPPVVDHDFLDSFALDLSGKFATYARLLRDLPAGLSEWAVHPGLGDAESRAIDSGWRVRQTDLEFLTSPEAREILQCEQIVVIDYRSLQQAWS